MTNSRLILNKLGSEETFSRSDLRAAMEECGIHTTDSTTNHLLIKLLEDGAVSRAGRNQYLIASSKRPYYFPHSNYAIELAEIIKDVHPYLDFRIFELIQLNEFVNHQIANNIVFISVERDLEGDVFNTLWDSHKGSILLKPDADTLFRYLTEDMIIISSLPTESPKGLTEFWDTRLEKLLVDIAVDKLLRKVIYAGEYPTIYH